MDGQTATLYLNGDFVYDITEDQLGTFDMSQGEFWLGSKTGDMTGKGFAGRLRAFSFSKSISCVIFPSLFTQVSLTTSRSTGKLCRQGRCSRRARCKPKRKIPLFHFSGMCLRTFVSLEGWPCSPASLFTSGFVLNATARRFSIM